MPEQEYLKEALFEAKKIQELAMIEVMVSLESRTDLGRPKESAKENRVNFMNAI